MHGPRVRQAGIHAFTPPTSRVSDGHAKNFAGAAVAFAISATGSPEPTHSNS